MFTYVLTNTFRSTKHLFPLEFPKLYVGRGAIASFSLSVVWALPAPNPFSHRFCGAHNSHRKIQWNFQWKKKVSDGPLLASVGGPTDDYCANNTWRFLAFRRARAPRDRDCNASTKLFSFCSFSSCRLCSTPDLKKTLLIPAIYLFLSISQSSRIVRTACRYAGISRHLERGRLFYC